MKRILSLMAASAMLHLAASARAANASACYSIGDADGRAHCIAKARKDPAMCWAIRQPDLRSACLAEARK